MIIEYIRYETDDPAGVIAAYADAAQYLDASPHCLGHEVAQGVEEPGHVIVRIEWDSLEGHLEGFRKSEDFGAFFAAVKPFFSAIAEMKHYERR